MRTAPKVCLHMLQTHNPSVCNIQIHVQTDTNDPTTLTMIQCLRYHPKNLKVQHFLIPETCRVNLVKVCILPQTMTFSQTWTVGEKKPLLTGRDPWQKPARGGAALKGRTQRDH